MHDWTELLDIADAAKRVKRGRRTIERWIADGDLVVDVVMRDAAGRVVRRYVREDALLATFRAKLQADPSRPRLRDGDTPP